MTQHTCIALIPARSGSIRIKDKNIRILNGHPLIAYAITTAIRSGIFKRVIVSTDSLKYAEIARYYGAEVPFLRPKSFASSVSPDIEWLKYTLIKLNENTDYFSLLRPTNPFRSVQMITDGWNIIVRDKSADSLRAVEKCLQHPAKMWIIKGNRMKPIISNPNLQGIEWYSTPMQVLPDIYAQNSSLEFAKCSIPLTSNSIAGNKIIPYITRGFEGYDINSEKDWIYAEYLLRREKVFLPEIDISAYSESQ